MQNSVSYKPLERQYLIHATLASPQAGSWPEGQIAHAVQCFASRPIARE